VKDLSTGATLVSESPDAPRYPASLTKLMTLYLLFERLDSGTLQLDHQFVFSRNAARQPPTKLGLRPGSRISAEECIEALIVKSANDVAVVVAEGLGGSEAAFARMMTAKARELGMEGTEFRNASGLPDPGQVTTSRDLALLAAALVEKFPQFYQYFSLRECKVGRITLTTHNNFLEMYDGAEGMKTGYTRDAGYNLVATAERGGHRLLGVILGAEGARGRDALMAVTLDSAFMELGVPQPAPRAMAPSRAPKPAPVAARALRAPLHRARVVRRRAAKHRKTRAA
jgi:D-alanyl-D-alanine carboxypeptidase